MAHTRRRRSRGWSWTRRTLAALALVPALYLLAALIGSQVPVNAGWHEPAQGTTVYLVNNGVHADIVMPIKVGGLDWRPLFPAGDFIALDPDARFIAFGAGEERVYLNTPRWRDITPRTAWSALTGGRRVLHVAYVPAPFGDARAIRLRPEEYRRLWAAIRVDLGGPPRRIDHPGYGPDDAFYRAIGRSSAVNTCNNWVAGKLRFAGVKASLWPPFEQGLVWRYRRADISGGVQ